MPRDVGQHRTEAGGGDAEHDDQGDGRGQHPPDRAQRLAGEDHARLPADHHVADLDQDRGHRQAERQPGDLQHDGQRQGPEQPGTGQPEEPTTGRAREDEHGHHRHTEIPRR